MNTKMTTYNLYNLSSVVNNNQLQSMVKAMNIYLITFCNDWGLAPIQLSISTYNSNRPLTNVSIFILNDSDQESALGYHFETNGVPIARVFARTILNYGGVILYKDATTFTVAQCLAHEVLETINNTQISLWSTDNYSNFWAYEMCDAVESNLIIYTLPQNIKVALSDYLLPKYFAADATSGPYNKKNTLPFPYSIDNGGYSIVIENVSGDVVELYGMNPTHSNIHYSSFTASVGITHSYATHSVTPIISGSYSMTLVYGTHSITYGVGTYSGDNKLLNMQSYLKSVNPNKRTSKILNSIT